MSKKARHLGAIYTPEHISQLIVNWAIQSKTDRILDLGVGEGAFVFSAYKRLRQLGASENDAQKLIFGSEIDQDTFVQFNEHIAAKNLSFPNIENADFFNYQTGMDDPFSVVIGNPPYVRRKNISNLENIRRVVEINSDMPNISIRSLSDLYIYFVLYAASRLESGGRLSIITADSWLNVGYGKVLRLYLSQLFQVIQITTINYPIFDNAEVKAVILQAVKGKPSNSHCLNFAHVTDPKVLMNGILKTEHNRKHIDYSIPQIHINPNQPWGIYWKIGDLYQRIVSNSRIAQVQNIARTQIGYQTLAKDFFIFDKAKTGLVEHDFLQPLVHSPSEYRQHPVINEYTPISTYVFMCDLEKDELANTKTLEYILNAEKKTVSVRGKDKTVIGYHSKKRIQRSGRKNWYDLKTHIANRGGNCSILVPRFIFRQYLVLWNQVGHVTGEQFIEFRPKLGFSEKVYLAILNSTLCELMFRAHSQIYGGGTNNMSPGEFKKMPIIDPSLLSDSQRRKLEVAYDKFIDNDMDRSEIDTQIAEILDFDAETTNRINSALSKIVYSSTRGKPLG